MKLILTLFIQLIFIHVIIAQSTIDSNLTKLSKDFQRVFYENGWKLHSPLQSGGLDFTDAPSFYRIKDFVHWSHKDYSLLNKYVTDNSTIRDSVLYKILGVYDSVSNSQVIDVEEFIHLKFINGGLFSKSGSLW